VRVFPETDLRPLPAKVVASMSSPAAANAALAQPTRRRPFDVAHGLRRRKESLATRGSRAPRGAGADRRTFDVPGRGTPRRHDLWRPAPNDAGRSPFGAPPRHLSNSGPRLRAPERAHLRAQNCPGVVHRVDARASAPSGRGSGRVRPSARLQSCARGEPLPPPPSVCLRTTPS